MVTGIEVFKQYFQAFPDDYILISGVACELVLNSMHLEFRLTEDWVYEFAPLDAGDEKSSLSAILFESEYYSFVRSNAIVLDGISTIRLEGLIPLKALAYHKLTQVESPSEKTLLDIEKHFKDIFQLVEILSDEKFLLPQQIASDLDGSLKKIGRTELSNDQIELLEHLWKVYNL